VFLENGRGHPAIDAGDLKSNPDLLHRFIGV
jgi:hypothetical protein